MNAIEIRNLSKSFRGMYAVDHLNMTVPVGAIYGFIGENGSGKSTTEKLICGHLVPDGGKIKLFGKDYTDAGVRVKVGALIENAGCFPNSSIKTNLMMQAINLGLENPEEEIQRVLKIVRMQEHSKLKFKSENAFWLSQGLPFFFHFHATTNYSCYYYNSKLSTLILSPWTIKISVVD